MSTAAPRSGCWFFMRAGQLWPPIEYLARETRVSHAASGPRHSPVPYLKQIPAAVPSASLLIGLDNLEAHRIRVA